MVATYSANLRLIEQGTGDDVGTWGTVLNTGMIELADFAISGMTTINSTGGTVTLTANNGTADQARSAILNVTGALVGDINIIAPAVTKCYVIANNTTGAHNVTINTTVPGVALNIPQGQVLFVYGDGTSFHDLTVVASLAGTATGNIDMNNFQFDRPAIKRYKEVFFDNGTTGGAITADYNNGNCQRFTLNANSTLAVSNFPSAGAFSGSMTIKFIQDATGGRTMTWPASFKFPSGSSNVLSVGANAVDIITIYTDDDGTTYNCNLIKGYS
jgi:hypothetical protein